MASPRFRAAIEKRLKEQEELAANIQGAIEADHARRRKYRIGFFLVVAVVAYGIQEKLLNPAAKSVKGMDFGMIKNQLAKEMQKKKASSALAPPGDDENIGKELEERRNQVAQKMENISKKGSSEPDSPGAPSERSGSALSSRDPDSPDLPKNDSKDGPRGLASAENESEPKEAKSSGDSTSEGMPAPSETQAKQNVGSSEQKSASGNENKTNEKGSVSSLASNGSAPANDNTSPYRQGGAEEGKRFQSINMALRPSSEAASNYEPIQMAPKKYKKETVASSLSLYEWR